jgi:phage terminase small subunit
MSQALTTRQALFVAAYKGNATQAALDANFSPRSARQHAARMMANAAIQAALAARQGVDARRLEISRQDAIRGLLEAIDQAREQSNPAAMIAGWKAIGQMLGFFEPVKHRVEVATVPDSDLMRKLHTMSDAELSALIAPEATALATV